MPDDSASISSSLRAKVSTGYGRLDEALQGGMLAGSVVVLNAPASDEVPILLGDFIQATQDRSLLICRTLSSAEAVTHDSGAGVKSLVCSDRPVPPSKNVIPGKGIDNLTDVNLQINEALSSIQPKRVVLDILSDVLLRHKGLQTRKWLTELLERLRSKGITTLAILNPYMHSGEDVQAVVDLFDGNIEIIEKEVEGTLRKFLRIKWMHDVEVTEKEFPLVNLIPEPQPASQQAAVTTIPLKEPRWLTPLVSRTEELSKLKSAIENALAERGSVVALQGEAGVGKTRLMHELAAYARSKKAAVLSGSASEDGVPYAPWVEVARQYVGQAPGELLRRMLGANASELVKLVPDLAAKLGTIPPSKTLGEQQDKLRFYEAVTQFFIAICKEMPLLLLFDDMQDADQSSLDLLEYFVRSTSNLRVLTICSYPTEDVPSDSPLRQTLMKFNKQRLLETVPVKNLNEEETVELIKQTFGEHAVSPEFADLIYTHTGGNPFFVEEVLRSLVEDGTIFRTEKGWDRKPIQDIIIPESVKTALKSRLTKLDPEALGILQWAAVIGTEFSFEVLLNASQVNEDVLLQRLETFASQGLVLEVPHERSKFRFADNRIRELLLDGILQIKRARYHLKIAEAVEKAYAKTLDSHAEAMAAHFSEGGDTERAIKYSIMAGDKNKSIHAHEQAVNGYQRALDLIDLEGGNEQQKAVVFEKLAASCLSAGQLQKATRCYEQALEIFDKLHDNKACARAYMGLSDIHGPEGSLGAREAIQILKKGLKHVEEEQESSEAASLYASLSWWQGIVDEWDEANAWAEKASAVGERTENFAAVATGLFMKGSFLTDTGRIEEGLPLWQRAFDVAWQHEQYTEALYSLFNVSVYTYPRDLAKAMEILLRLLDLSNRVNHYFFQMAAWDWLSYLNWLNGDWMSAMEQVQKAIDIRKRIFGMSEHFQQFVLRGRLSAGYGKLELAERDFRSALDLLDEKSKITDKVQVYLGLGFLKLEQGNEAEAKTHFEASVDAFRNWEFTTAPLLHTETLLHLASIYAKQGELEKEQEASRWGRRLAETLKSDAGLAMASQAEAALLLASGDGKGAEEAFLQCLASWEKAGWPYYKAKALVAYSEAIAQTNPEESKKRLAQAAEIFTKLGARRDLEKAQAKLSPTQT